MIIWPFTSLIFAFPVVCFGISWFNFCIPDPFHIILHCFVLQPRAVPTATRAVPVIFLVNALSKSRELRVTFLCAILRSCLLYCQGKIRESGYTTDGLH